MVRAWRNFWDNKCKPKPDTVLPVCRWGFWRAMLEWTLRFTLFTNAKDSDWLAISARGVRRLESRHYFWLLSHSLCSWEWPWTLGLPVSMSWNCWCEPGLWFSLYPPSLPLFFYVCVEYVNVCVQGCMQTQTSKEDAGCPAYNFPSLYLWIGCLTEPGTRLAASLLLSVLQNTEVSSIWSQPRLFHVGAEDLSQTSVFVQQALYTLSHLSNAAPYIMRQGLSHISPYSDVYVYDIYDIIHIQSYIYITV